MATKKITVPARGRDKIDLDLAGVEYTIPQPKAYTAAKYAAMIQDADDDPSKLVERVDEYLLAMFGKKAGKAISARLDNPEDDLGLEEIMDAVGQMVDGDEEDGADPTT